MYNVESNFSENVDKNEFMLMKQIVTKLYILLKDGLINVQVIRTLSQAPKRMYNNSTEHLRRS